MSFGIMSSWGWDMVICGAYGLLTVANWKYLAVVSHKLYPLRSREAVGGTWWRKIFGWAILFVGVVSYDQLNLTKALSLLPVAIHPNMKVEPERARCVTCRDLGAPTPQRGSISATLAWGTRYSENKTKHLVVISTASCFHSRSARTLHTHPYTHPPSSYAARR